MDSSDDDESSFFPSMPINFSSKTPYSPPFDLNELEHQVVLADGIVSAIAGAASAATATATATPSTTTTTTPQSKHLNPREKRLTELYTLLHHYATSINDGNYFTVLRDPVAQSLFSTITFGPGASKEVLQRDSDAWLLRKAKQSSAALLASCNVQHCTARYILSGTCSSSGGESNESDSEEEEEDDDDWLNDMEQRERQTRATLVVMIGAAALNAFVQQNWTGPPLEAGGVQQWVCATNTPSTSTSTGTSATAAIDIHTDVVQQRQDVRLALEVDGDQAFYKCELPELLLLSRTLLSLVATGGVSLGNAGWNYRKELMYAMDGSITPSQRAALKTICAAVGTSRWWAARASVIHHRTLIFDIDGNDSLRKNIVLHFDVLRAKYDSSVLVQSNSNSNSSSNSSSGDGSSDGKSESKATGGATTNLSGTTEDAASILTRRLAAQVELEYGLAQHHWGDVDSAKDNFELSKKSSGLSTHLTGFKGRKTKYQSFDTQHLVVVASSSMKEVHEIFTAPPPPPPRPLPLLPEEQKSMTVKKNTEALGMGSTVGTNESKDEATKTNKEVEDGKDGKDVEKVEDVEDVEEGGDDFYEERMHQLHGKTTATGVHEYTLDEVDQDNIVLETIKFTDEAYDNGSDLTLFDQCIILALCLDVKNSNPRSGLTQVEMMPYVIRVMESSATMNWMIHTSALVVRAWLEFEVWRTKTRAIMQLQALVDQHVNRLSAGQRAGTDYYAPTNQRMRYVYVLPLPSYWEMRNDLADRYMELHIKHSALRLYEDLERWEKVVQCYLDLEKDDEAIVLVKDRLKIRPSPMLYCCLGELEDDNQHFLTAWEFSGKRYSRALRLLAQRYDRTQEWEKALQYYLESTTASPNNRSAWWRIGAITMRSKQWNLSIKAWHNVTRIAPKDGEARANLGAVFTKLGMWEEAYQSFDAASKEEYQNWRVWENKMFCSARTKRYAEAINAQKRVVELRRNRKTVPLDWLVLEKMTHAIVESVVRGIREERQQANGAAATTAVKEVVVVVEDEQEEEFDRNDANIFPSMVPMGDELVDKEEEDAEDQKSNNGSTVSNEQKMATTTTSEQYSKDLVDYDGLPARRHVDRLLKMLEFVVQHVPTSSSVWDCYGNVCQVLGNASKMMDCFEKSLRALERGNWVEEQSKAEELGEAALKLCSVYHQIKKPHQARLVIKSIVDKLTKRGKEVSGIGTENGSVVDSKWRTALIARLQTSVVA